MCGRLAECCPFKQIEPVEEAPGSGHKESTRTSRSQVSANSVQQELDPVGVGGKWKVAGRAREDDSFSKLSGGGRTATSAELVGLDLSALAEKTEPPGEPGKEIHLCMFLISAVGGILSVLIVPSTVCVAQCLASKQILREWILAFSVLEIESEGEGR